MINSNDSSDESWGGAEIHLFTIFTRYLTKHEGGCKVGLTNHHFTWDFPGFSTESPISGTFLCPRKTEMAGYPKWSKKCLVKSYSQ